MGKKIIGVPSFENNDTLNSFGDELCLVVYIFFLFFIWFSLEFVFFLSFLLVSAPHSEGFRPTGRIPLRDRFFPPLFPSVLNVTQSNSSFSILIVHKGCLKYLASDANAVRCASSCFDMSFDFFLLNYYLSIFVLFLLPSLFLSWELFYYIEHSEPQQLRLSHTFSFTSHLNISHRASLLFSLIILLFLFFLVSMLFLFENYFSPGIIIFLSLLLLLPPPLIFVALIIFLTWLVCWFRAELLPFFSYSK